MPLNAGNWAELITPQTSAAFYMGFDGGGRRQSLIPTLYRVTDSQRAFEDLIGVGQLSSDGWSFEGTGRVEYDDFNKGFLTRFTHGEFAKGLIVQRKLVDDNLTQIVFDRAENLGDAAFRFREKSAAKVFNNAFVTTVNSKTTDEEGFPVALADGGALCDAAHKSNDAGSGSTQSNTGASALTKANVSATRISMMAFKDDVGDKLDVTPDTLIVPPDLEDTALEICRSALDPTSANHAINPQSGRYQIVVWHYLTSATKWWMAEMGRMKQALIWYDRIPLEFAREEDFDTLEAKFRAYMRFSRRAKDWRWVYGQNA